MKLCPVCKKEIKKGQKIAVFSYPLESLDMEGSYDYMTDFLNNEKVAHEKCFTKVCRSLVNAMDKDNGLIPFKTEDNYCGDVSETVSMFKETLSALGEKVSNNEAQVFLIKNSGIKSIDELISNWFKSRNKME